MESRWKSVFSLKRSPKKGDPRHSQDESEWSAHQEVTNRTWGSRGRDTPHASVGHDPSTMHSFNVYPNISESSKFHDMDISSDSRFQNLDDSSLSSSSMWRTKSQPSMLRSPTLDISEIKEDANDSKQKSSKFGWLRKSFKRKSKSDVKKMSALSIYGNKSCIDISDINKNSQVDRQKSPSEEEWCPASPRACQTLKSAQSSFDHSSGGHKLEEQQFAQMAKNFGPGYRASGDTRKDWNSVTKQLESLRTTQRERELALPGQHPKSLQQQSPKKYDTTKCQPKQTIPGNLVQHSHTKPRQHIVPPHTLGASCKLPPGGPNRQAEVQVNQSTMGIHGSMEQLGNSEHVPSQIHHNGALPSQVSGTSRLVATTMVSSPLPGHRNYENIPTTVTRVAHPTYPATQCPQTTLYDMSGDRSISPQTQRLPPQGESDSSGSVLLKSPKKESAVSHDLHRTVTAKSSDIAELYQQHGNMWRVWSQPNLGELDSDHWPSPIEQVSEIYQPENHKTASNPRKAAVQQTSTPSPRKQYVVSSAPTTPIKKGSDHDYENLPPMPTPSRRWRTMKKAKSHYVLGLQTHVEDPLNESDEESRPYFPKSASHPSILDSDNDDYCEIHGHSPRGRQNRRTKPSSPFHSPSSRSSSGSSLSPGRTLRSRSKSSRSRSSNSRSRSRHSKSRSRSRAMEGQLNDCGPRPGISVDAHIGRSPPKTQQRSQHSEAFGDSVRKSKSHGNLRNGRMHGVAPDTVPNDETAISSKTKRSWATLGDIPNAVMDDDHVEWDVDGYGYSAMDVSMATTASYIPGGSLADKLRLAASKGQSDKVCELVASGATFQPDKEGRTALHYAALNGYADVVKYLIDQGCDLDLQDNLGYTALHRAAAQGHLDVIRVLLNEGCLLDRQDEVHGNSALHEAAWNGYSRTLELLVKHHANVLVTNKAGFTALHLAAQNGHNQSARVLLYANCLPDYKNNYGDTALHTAARYGHAGVTRILVSAKCNINEQNKNGDTALHISAALKRRKIAKLMTESLINVSLKNKQNESAIDVARRKDFPEIILIITSQPKNKKKKKLGGKGKSEKEKMTVEISEDSEKKGKKGFFFRKKAKPKAEKEKLSTGAVAAGTTTAASEVSSFQHFNHEMHPQQLLMGFRNHQQRQIKPPGQNPTQNIPGPNRPRVPHERHGPAGSSAGSIRGIVSEYVPKEGVQYYRDLAGNIKQGPVGFTPVCSCAPGLKRLEQRVDADRANLYDHIDASHRTLTDRIDTLDRRTAQQVYAIDKLTKERLDAERKGREDYLESRLLRERIQTDRQLELQQDCIQTEVKAWVDARLTTFERNYGDAEGLLDHAPSLRTIHKYKSLSKKRLQGHGLYRSRSDETLSISSSHPSKRHFKMRQKTMQEMKKMRMPNVHRRAAKFEEKVRGLTVRDKPQGEGHQSRPLTYHEDMRVPSGRSPEGHSGEVAFCEVEVHNNQWGTQHIPRNCAMVRQFEEGDGKPNNAGLQQIQNDLGNMSIRDDDRSALSDTYAQTCHSESSLDAGPRLPLHPGSYAPHPSFVPTKYVQEHSPESNTGSQSKGDSASNPDSGYGSKIYGVHPPSGKSVSVSFGGSSTGSHDHHDSSIVTNGSVATDNSSPATYASIHSDGEAVPASRHFYGTVSNQLEKWYERRVVERKADDRVKPDSFHPTTRINRHDQNGIEFCGHATEV